MTHPDPFHRATMRALLATSPTRTLRGLRVTATPSEKQPDAAHLFAQVDAALALVERHQPWRLAHMRRDVGVVWVRLYPVCRAAFEPAERVCLLDSFFVHTFTPQEIGASIVHEGVHARVNACGLSRAETLGREERMCRRAELWFGRAIPDGGVVVRRATAMLALDDDALHIPPAELAAAHARGAAEFLDDNARTRRRGEDA